MWYYIFWFPNERAAKFFARNFNSRYETRTLVSQPDSVYPEVPASIDSYWNSIYPGQARAEIEDPVNDDPDLLIGWFLELESSRKLADHEFDRLAKSYHGEYDAVSQVRPNPSLINNPDSFSPEDRVKMEEVIKKFDFVPDLKKPGHWAEMYSGLLVRDRTFRRWFKESPDNFSKRVESELWKILHRKPPTHLKLPES